MCRDFDQEIEIVFREGQYFPSLEIVSDIQRKQSNVNLDFELSPQQISGSQDRCECRISSGKRDFRGRHRARRSHLAVLGQFRVSLLELQLQDTRRHEGHAAEEAASHNPLEGSLENTELPCSEELTYH